VPNRVKSVRKVDVAKSVLSGDLFFFVSRPRETRKELGQLLYFQFYTGLKKGDVKEADRQFMVGSRGDTC